MNKTNLETPAFLSRYILWSKPSIHASSDYVAQ